MNSEWLKPVFQWGPVAAIVFFLLFQSAGWVPSLALEVKESLHGHEVAREKAMTEQTDALRSLIKLQQESGRLQTLACLREARSEADRQACLK